MSLPKNMGRRKFSNKHQLKIDQMYNPNAPPKRSSISGTLNTQEDQEENVNVDKLLKRKKEQEEDKHRKMD